MPNCSRDAGLGTPPQPIYFEPVSQVPNGLTAMFNQLGVPVNWVIRTSGDPLTLTERIRREALVASGGVPMAEPRLLEQVIDGSIARQRFSMLLLGVFAGLAYVTQRDRTLWRHLIRTCSAYARTRHPRGTRRCA